MPFITPWDKIPAATIRKRLGKPNGFGWIIPGWSEFGDSCQYSGVYQQRHHRKWDGNGGFIITSAPINFFQKPAWPIQPPSVLRNAQQEKFKTALSMWQSLTDEQKAVYNTIGTKRSKRCYDLFMHKTLKSL